MDEEDHLVALIELKEGLGTDNIFENLVSDGNALGQLLHAAVLARVERALVQCYKPVTLMLASSRVWHCFLVKLDKVIKIKEYCACSVGNDYRLLLYS